MPQMFALARGILILAAYFAAFSSASSPLYDDFHYPQEEQSEWGLVHRELPLCASIAANLDSAVLVIPNSGSKTATVKRKGMFLQAPGT